MKLVCLAAALAALHFSVAVSAQSNPSFSSLEEQMTQREFEASGLDKLTDEELIALNRWIRSRSLATLEQPRANVGQAAVGPEGLPSTPGELPPIDRMAREPFETRIVGEFDGWTGNTVFELENGMVWRQAERDRRRFQPMQNPVVIIKPGLFGAWYLTVEGQKRKVRVERIK